MMKLAIVLASLAAVSAAAPQRAVPSQMPTPPVRAAVGEVARVNGVPVMSDRLEAAVNALIPLESFHRGVSPEKMAALRQKALQNLVDQELQYQDGVRLGLTVTDTEVNAALARMKTKYTSPQAFARALGSAGMTPAALRREIRRSLKTAKAHDRAVASKCQVSRDEAVRFFEANPERFVIPEQLHVYAITIGVDPSSSTKQWGNAKSRAEDVLRQLKAGAPFEEMARKYSTDPSKTKGGDMGFVHRGSLSDDFEKVTRDLKPGHVSDVVQTLYGYHIVSVTGVRWPRRKTFSEVDAEIQKHLTAKRCGEMHDAWLARLRTGAAVVLADPKPGIAPQAPRAGGQMR